MRQSLTRGLLEVNTKMAEIPENNMSSEVQLLTKGLKEVNMAFKWLYKRFIWVANLNTASGERR